MNNLGKNSTQCQTTGTKFIYMNVVFFQPARYRIKVKKKKKIGEINTIQEDSKIRAKIA